MSEAFNYEDYFMGVIDSKQKNYLRTFSEDYRLKHLTESLTIEKGKMLDIGCGGGILTESLPYYFPKTKVYGCDVSKQAISYARKFGSGNVIYSIIRGKKLPYKNNFFDVCICLDVMEHIPDISFFLKEVKRILKKDGKFFIIVPCEGQRFTHTWLWQKLKIGNNMTYKRFGHIHPEFTYEYVENLLKKNKFQIKKKLYSEHILYQLIALLTYFIPLELMDIFLGSKADIYSDRGVIRAKKKKKLAFDPFMILRNIWMKMTTGIKLITLWELDVLKKVPFAAWKLHILVVNKK